MKTRKNKKRPDTVRTTIALRPETWKLLRALKKATGANNIGDAIEMSITGEVNVDTTCPRCAKIKKLFKEGNKYD